MKFLKLNKFIKNKVIREWVEALIFAIVVATLFRTWLYSPFKVPSGSMLPTIQIGDHLFADMNHFGFIVPFTGKKILADPVKRGDVIIFPYPKNPPECDGFFYSTFDTAKYLVGGLFGGNIIPTCQDFIKRVVAVAGDHLVIKGEIVTVNGERESGYTPYLDPMRNPIPDNLDVVIPEGKLFMMGDNRRNSSDSRVWGYLDEENVRALAGRVFLSFDPQASNIFSSFRYDRIGMSFN